MTTITLELPKKKANFLIKSVHSNGMTILCDREHVAVLEQLPFVNVCDTSYIYFDKRFDHDACVDFIHALANVFNNEEQVDIPVAQSRIRIEPIRGCPDVYHVFCDEDDLELVKKYGTVGKVRKNQYHFWIDKRYKIEDLETYFHSLY